MKAVIHQTLRHVFDFNACTSPLAQVDYAFVGDEAMFALEKNGKVRFQPFGDVICVENRDLARAFQSRGAHHANVHPRDGQNTGAAPRSACNIATVASTVPVISTDCAARGTLPLLSFAKQVSA